MRWAYVLLLAVCIVITACDALSFIVDYEHQVVTQKTEAELRDNRLLRSANIATENDAVDDEERGIIPSPITDLVKKVTSKGSDTILRVVYKIWRTLGKSDDDIYKMWVEKGKSTEQIYKRWLRLGKTDDNIYKLWVKQGKSTEQIYNVLRGVGNSDEQISRLFLNNGLPTEGIYRLLDRQGKSMDDLYDIWRRLGLHDAEIYNIWLKSGKNDNQIYTAWFNADKKPSIIRTLLHLDQGDVYKNRNSNFYLGYENFFSEKLRQMRTTTKAKGLESCGALDKLRGIVPLKLTKTE